jgi:hypothetical protein
MYRSYLFFFRNLIAKPPAIARIKIWLLVTHIWFSSQPKDKQHTHPSC